MSRPLLELRGRHVVVLQVKVPQVALVKQLVDNVRRASPSAFLPKIEASSARSRESPDAFSSSVAVGSCHTGGTAGEGVGRKQGCKVSVINGCVTLFLRRFFL